MMVPEGMAGRCRNFVLVFLFAGAGFFCFSQDEATFDALEKYLLEVPAAQKQDPNFKKSKVFFFQRNYDSTLVYTNKYLTSKAKKPKVAPYCLFFRGVSLSKKGLFAEARETLLEIPKSMSVYPHVNINLGVIELSEKKYEKALAYFLKVVDQHLIKEFDLNEGVIYHNIGICYLHLERFEEAEKALFHALTYQEARKDTNRIVSSYLDVANLYYIQYKDDLAIPFFVKGYELSKRTTDFELKKNAALNMSIVEGGRKNFEMALVYRNEYDQWKDSLNDQQKVWAIAQAEKELLAEQGRKERLVLEKDNSIRMAERNGFIYSSILLLILLLTGIYFYRQKLKANRIIQAQKQKVDALNEMKNQLFSIVSHDLRSSVNAFKINNAALLEMLESGAYANLKELVASNGAIANSTYTLLDNLLNWALLQTEQIYFLKEMHPTKKVVDQVVINYAPLFKEKDITFENSITASDRVFADLDSLKLVVRNLLDNALKFTPVKGSIRVSSLSDDRYCRIVIEDTGIGMSEEVLLELRENSSLVSKKNGQGSIGTGLGMQLCKSMLAQNQGTMHIESKEGKGTKITLEIPKQTP